MLVHGNQATVGKQSEAVLNVARQSVSRSDRTISRFHAERRIEDGEAAEEYLRVLREEVIAPGNRVAHGLLARLGITKAAGEYLQSAPKAQQQSVWCEYLDTRRCQFNSEWQTIQAATYLGHGGCRLHCQFKVWLHRPAAL